MLYCTNCGKQLNDNDRFCSGCGSAVGQNQENTNRKNVYDGEIHKCPNCGEVLESFISNCPSCGYEIRGAVSSAAVQEFAAKLEKAISLQERITIVRNFPIPNTREDIYEFLILASANVSGDLDNGISEAWKSKIEQAYKKAQLVFKNSEEFAHIQNIYSQVMDKLAKDRKIKNVKKTGALISELMPVLPNVIIVAGWLISIFVLLPLCRINLDNVGTNSYQLLLMLDLVVGAMLVPFAFRCESSLPKVITSLGLILSIIVLIPLCGKNLDNVGTNAFQLILIVDIICSTVILIRLFKHKNKADDNKIALNGVSFIIALICIAVFLVVYGIGSILASIDVAEDYAANDKADQEAQSVTYEWPKVGHSKYLPIPQTPYGYISTDNETRFAFELYQVTTEQFESYVQACKSNGFTISTTKTDSTFYAYNEVQFKLDIFFYADKREMHIFLDAPKKMDKIYWPQNNLVKKLPVPTSLVGRIWSDTSNTFGVYIANIDSKSFAAYIDACMGNGFNIDYAREDDFFKAYDKDGCEVTLRLQYFDVMQIYIELPKYD